MNPLQAQILKDLNRTYRAVFYSVGFFEYKSDRLNLIVKTDSKGKVVEKRKAHPVYVWRATLDVDDEHDVTEVESPFEHEARGVAFDVFKELWGDAAIYPEMIVLEKCGVLE